MFTINSWRALEILYFWSRRIEIDLVRPEFKICKLCCILSPSYQFFTCAIPVFVRKCSKVLLKIYPLLHECEFILLWELNSNPSRWLWSKLDSPSLLSSTTFFLSRICLLFSISRHALLLRRSVASIFGSLIWFHQQDNLFAILNNIIRSYPGSGATLPPLPRFPFFPFSSPSPIKANQEPAPPPDPPPPPFL